MPRVQQPTCRYFCENPHRLAVDTANGPGKVYPMSNFKIEKGVPIPGMGPDGASGYRATLRALEVGDSFQVPVHVNLGTQRSVAFTVGKELGRKFSWRGTRVWRTL